MSDATAPRELAVYAGTRRLGSIITGAGRTVSATTAAGGALGTFPDRAAAVAALLDWAGRALDRDDDGRGP
ncbi:MAG: hypothetical protein IT561_18985 [Alphaproteobacteria bacterium]|nr:hypothetical protein [Alphaproteobacteria bacterium]